LFKFTRWTWRKFLRAGRALGLSDTQISTLSQKASYVWDRVVLSEIFRGGFFRRIGLILLGGLGKYVSPTINSERLVNLIQRVRPVSSPFPLVRIGGPGDGGYLVPDDLNGITACFSPGVADSASFELGMAELSIPSFMADYSVNGPPVANSLFHFEKLFLESHSDGKKFVRLEDWVTQNADSDGDLILQMDIEGSEWPVLLDTPDQTLKRFRIMVIEFHDLDQMMTTTLGAEVFSTLLDKLSRNFKVVHLHVNNAGGIHKFRGQTIPRVIELTFLRNDRFDLSSDKYPALMPHPLDEPNMPWGKDITLTGPWRPAIESN
jgi:hypothetical protein